MPGEDSGIAESVMVSLCYTVINRRLYISQQDAFRVLHPQSSSPVPLDQSNQADAEIIRQLGEVLGELFADRLMSDSAWARGVLTGDAAGL